MAGAGRRWPGRVAARAGLVPVLLAEEEGDRGGGARRAGPPAAAGLRRGGEAQVSFSPLYFCFSNFSDICFDLINILNHLILLCQFL